MAWKREDDVLKGIDPAGIQTDVFCRLRRKHKFVVDVEHDAAVRFLYDLKELLDQRFIRRDLDDVEVRLREQYVRVIGDVLADISNSAGNELRQVNFEIAPVFAIRCAYGDQHPLVKPIVQRLEDAAKNMITDGQTERDKRGEGQETHDNS